MLVKHLCSFVKLGNMSISLLYNYLYLLIRSSLIGTNLDPKSFEKLTPKDWSKLYEIAQKQGVLAITFESIQKYRLLSAGTSGNGFMLELLMKWAGYWSVIKQQYNKHLQTSLDLSYYLQRYGCEFLVMKGLALADYYPIPELRNFGDIDIYSFKDHLKVNNAIIDNGIEIEYGAKHDVFQYNGLTVEHHVSFLGLISESASVLENYLQKVAIKDKCIKSSHGWYKPNEEFNAIFLLRHMSKHYFGEGISLKQIIDWGLFLSKSDINFPEIRSILIKSKMEKAWNVFSKVASIIFDLDFSKYYIGTPDEYTVNRVLEDIMDYDPKEENSSSKIKRLVLKSND